MAIPLTDVKSVNMFTSQDFNEFSVISSIYVWVFYCHNILSRIVLSSVILVFTTTMRKNSIFLFSNTLSQIAHFDFTFFFGNKMTIPLRCWDIFVYLIACANNIMSCLLESNSDSSIGRCKDVKI